MKVEATLNQQTTEVEIRAPNCRQGNRFEIVLGRGEEAQSHSVSLLNRCGNRWTLQIGNRIEDVLIHSKDGEFRINWRDRLFAVQVQDIREKFLAGAAGTPQARSGSLIAQMPGKVVEVFKTEGDEVEAGQGLAVIEAMKMQNELKAPRSGVVKLCNVEEGQNVEGGFLLFEIE